jgi:hypothetical protein
MRKYLGEGVSKIVIEFTLDNEFCTVVKKKYPNFEKEIRRKAIIRFSQLLIYALEDSPLIKKK